MGEAQYIAEARRWLLHAQEDLVTAQTLLKLRTAVPRHICWLAQQAAEKTLKAALLYLRIDPHEQHDLDALRRLLPSRWQVQTTPSDLKALSAWATHALYPGNWSEATPSDALLAVEQARSVWDAALSDLGRQGLGWDE
jgi:HEPN domain-containing protein